MHKTLKTALNKILSDSEVHGCLCNEKTVCSRIEERKGLALSAVKPLNFRTCKPILGTLFSVPANTVVMKIYRAVEKVSSISNIKFVVQS